VSFHPHFVAMPALRLGRVGSDWAWRLDRAARNLSCRMLGRELRLLRLQRRWRCRNGLPLDSSSAHGRDRLGWQLGMGDGILVGRNVRWRPWLSRSPLLLSQTKENNDTNDSKHNGQPYAQANAEPHLQLVGRVVLGFFGRCRNLGAFGIDPDDRCLLEEN
jgi:hypothetical protein